MLRLARRLLSLPVLARQIRPIRRSKQLPFKPKFDSLEDRVVPDGGRPYPLPIIYVGSGGGMLPIVRAYDVDKGTVTFEKQVYESAFTGGVRVATGDITLDGIPDLIVAPGPGGGSRIQVLDGVTGETVAGSIGNFYAYDPSFTGGVFIACADVTGDTIPDVITAAGLGGGPHIKVFNGLTGELYQEFFAFAPDFRGGSTIGAADLTGNGIAEIVVGAGPGGGPHVRVFNAETGKQLPGPVGSFFAFDPSDRHGIDVNTDTLAGDVTGDGHPDIVVGLGAGTACHVKVFDGKTGLEARSFAPFDSNMTAGVRVATAYITDDPYAEIVVGTGPGVPGTVRVFDGVTMAKISGPMGEFQPFEGADSGGLYIAASNDPVVTSAYTNSYFGPAVHGQTVEFFATVVKQSGYPTPTGTVTFRSSLGNIVLGSGTLQPDANGINAVTSFVVPASLYAGTQDGIGVSILYNGDGVYANYGYFSGAYVSFNAGLLPGCDPCYTRFAIGDGQKLQPPSSFAGGVNSNGTVQLTKKPFSGMTGSAPDESTTITGTLPLTETKSAQNLTGAIAQDEVALYLHNPDGSASVNGTSIALFENGNPSLFFDRYRETLNDPFEFHPRNGQAVTIVEDDPNNQIIITDAEGAVYTFWNFASGNGGKKGRLQSKYSPDGSSYTVITWNGSGQPEETQTVVGSGGTAITESITRTTSGGVTTDTLRRKIGTGSWTTVRTAETSLVNGSSLNEIQVTKDASGNAIGTTYFRYDGNQYQGSNGRVKYVFGPDAYARLVAAFGTNVNTLTDGQIDDYADRAFVYDSMGRVTSTTVAGDGCSACTAGQGTYTYAYIVRESDARHANVWVRKVVETLPDASTNTYYFDAENRLLLKDISGQISAYRYDTTGRLILEASPAAVSGYDDDHDDLLEYTGNTATYLRDSEGLIQVYTYATSTTATPSTAGDVALYLKQTAIRRGDTGSDVLQSSRDYIVRTVSSDDYFFPASYTQYRNDNGTGGQTTSMAYTWHGSTSVPASITVTQPTVTTAQNGPNTASSSTVVFDSIGRPIWSKDAAGYLSYTAYDDATGAVVKSITDVNTANTGDFVSLPGGWSTPGGGGLHLISTFEVDDLGRTTKSVAPNGRIDYTVYKDSSQEVRYYSGWNTGTNLPTGPTSVSRYDRANGYSESLSMSATPTVSSGRPTGTESIGSLQSLSRSYRNLAGQVTTTDTYFNLSGVTYSTAANIGTINTNYYRTTFDYGKQYGQLNRYVSSLGTVTRTEYDTWGRATSIWVGTDDIPTTGSWATNNLTGTNMVKVREMEYDINGNLTESSDLPGVGYPRVTVMNYDWRNRLVAMKQGVSASEASSTNRPITYYDYDNLGQVTKTRIYDGDTLTVTSTNGVPNAPSASALRIQYTSSFDELGRVYLSEQYFVNPSTGDLTTNTNTLKSKTWYDARGFVIKTSQPDGLVQKMVYDGAGRNVTSYVTDGGGDSGYSDADDVTGDKVLEQYESAYDASGNILSQTVRQRNHDETGTGTLGTSSTGNKARVSYLAYYYDVGDRTMAVANYGTNGASSWTRPGSVASRSDTVLVTSFDYDSAGYQWKVTDPKGIEYRTYFDARGRTTKTIENYVDGTVGDDNDKTTEYTYNAAGKKTFTYKFTGGGSQTTEWIYGTTTGGGHGVNSNDLISATSWPDPSTGASSSGQQDSYILNAFGETVSATDRNGNTHSYLYDDLGRQYSDSVTTLGSGIDGTIRRMEVRYDIYGQVIVWNAYDAATSGNIVNSVLRHITGLGQVAREYQEHNGNVVTGGGSPTPYVGFSYSEMASGANHSRPTVMYYQNGRQISYNYGTSGSLDDSLSRLSALKDGATTLESYDYLGLDTVVKRGHAQSGVDLTYIKASGEGNGDAGDQYTGLDRFGRVVDQRWRTSSVEKDRYQYGYDRNGNRLYRNNLVNTSFGELYAYDNLNQLSSFDRGTLNGSKNGLTGAASRSQDWDYDALGNFDSVTTDGGSPVTRTHNKQNEITAVSGATSPVFDSNGNMTTDETGKQYVYDAWNRLVTVKNSGGTTIASYEYDGLSRRIQETAGGVSTDLYYSDQWQVIEERVSGAATKSYVWSPVYVDALVARDRDTDANGSFDERLYVLHDANFNVTGLVNTSGTVVERYTYDPYGVATVRDGSWTAGSTAYVWQYLHQGGRLSDQSGLYSFRYREYSPTLNVWTTIDPIDYLNGTRLNYVAFSNSPLIYVDPEGLQPRPSTLLGIIKYNLKNTIWNTADTSKVCPKDWEYEHATLPAVPKPVHHEWTVRGRRIGPIIYKKTKHYAAMINYGWQVVPLPFQSTCCNSIDVTLNVSLALSLEMGYDFKLLQIGGGVELSYGIGVTYSKPATDKIEWMPVLLLQTVGIAIDMLVGIRDPEWVHQETYYGFTGRMTVGWCKRSCEVAAPKEKDMLP
jgi:RHS repeat-associated protein